MIVQKRATGLEVIGASAGSGKTYKLTERVCDAVDPRGDDAITPERLLGVTFTIRAADELASRLRRRLLSSHAIEQAQKLPLAYLGTVHSVCFRLLAEHAIDAGLPPNVEVLADAKNLQLQRVVERTLSVSMRSKMAKLAQRLQIEWDARTRRSNWLYDVYHIMDLVRSNRIEPSELTAMAERSVAELLALLPEAKSNGALMDGELARELKRAIEGLERAIQEGDTTKGTQQALEQLQNIRRIPSDELDWASWVALSQVGPSKKAREHVEDLLAVAGEFEAHPRLHADLRDFICGVFEVARQALQAYEEWRQQRRLVDYVDMLDRALKLLDDEGVCEELRQRLKLVVVDEFQDTSPIQLSLFVALHQLASRSVWVGDPKQCIFEFAGADPRLMRQVLAWAKREGGTAGQLDTNYRSRPGLVSFCSQLFSGALAPYGYAPDDVSVKAARGEEVEHAGLPALGHWQLEVTNMGQEVMALAEGIARLLEDPTATPVLDRHTKKVRGLRTGDVAVLVRSNDEAHQLAAALSSRRIRAAMARPGLLETPEGIALRAGLDLLFDERDELARATLDALHEWNGETADSWLEHRIQRYRARKNGSNEATEASEAPLNVRALPSWESSLDALRRHLATLSPEEAVLGVLDALDATTLALRWSEPGQRLANLDALRALATEYEALCASENRACTLAGLLLYFDTVQQVMWNGEEMTANDDQSFTEDAEAVVISTYHRSKGLEWPVVILSSLDKGPRNDAFGVHLETDSEDFDPDAPLTGRWIRYWSWPFGGRSKGIGLKENEEKSKFGIQVRAEEREERARLLYVGMTRARDHLIFATRMSKGQPRVAWLDELCGAEGPLVSFANDEICVGAPANEFAARVWQLAMEEPKARENDMTPPSLFARNPVGPSTAPAFNVTPSSAGASWSNVPRPKFTQVERISGPIQVRRTKDLDFADFGTAVHGFFACDTRELSEAQRKERATRLLAPLGDPSPIAVEDVLKASDSLSAHIESRWPGAVWHREISVSAVVPVEDGARKVSGTIDLLLETEDGLILIDHKSFPDPTVSHLKEAAQRFAPQLGAYIAALRNAHSKPVKECWIHFPVGGILVGGAI